MGRANDELVPLDLTLVRRTDAAWLVKDGRGTEGWLPMSQVDFPHGAQERQVVTVEVPQWLVDDRGLD